MVGAYVHLVVDAKIICSHLLGNCFLSLHAYVCCCMYVEALCVLLFDWQFSRILTLCMIIKVFWPLLMEDYVNMMFSL